MAVAKVSLMGRPFRGENGVVVAFVDAVALWSFEAVQ